MPPYAFNPRITTGRPNHPCNHVPAKRIIFRYDGKAPKRSDFPIGSEGQDKYHQARYDYVERLLFNDSEIGQAEIQAQEDERLRREKEAKKSRKEEQRTTKDKDKQLKKYGESSKGHKEERQGLLGGSRRH